MSQGVQHFEPKFQLPHKHSKVGQVVVWIFHMSSVHRKVSDINLNDAPKLAPWIHVSSDHRETGTWCANEEKIPQVWAGLWMDIARLPEVTLHDSYYQITKTNCGLKWDPSGPSDHPFRWDPTSSIWMACFPPSSYWDTQTLWKSPKISCCFWKILRHPTRLTARLTGTHVVRRFWKGGGWCDQRHRREPAEIRTEALPRFFFCGEFLAADGLKVSCQKNYKKSHDAEWCWMMDWWKPDFFFIQHDKFKGRFGNQKKIKRIWISASKSLLC